MSVTRIDKNMDKDETIPDHIVIVMDGNGRWAKKRFLPRTAGHHAGVKATRKVVEYCAQARVPVLTLFADAAAMMVRGVDIRNQQWDQALDAILSAQGLGWRRQSDVLDAYRNQAQSLPETFSFI